MSNLVKHRICHHSQWIKTTVEGKLDLEQSLQVIRALDDDFQTWQTVSLNELSVLQHAPHHQSVRQAKEADTARAAGKDHRQAVGALQTSAPARALELLDAMRWLDRLGYHTWRISNYLGREDKPEPPAAAAAGSHPDE